MSKYCSPKSIERVVFAVGLLLTGISLCLLFPNYLFTFGIGMISFSFGLFLFHRHYRVAQWMDYRKATVANKTSLYLLPIIVSFLFFPFTYLYFRLFSALGFYPVDIPQLTWSLSVVLFSPIILLLVIILWISGRKTKYPSHLFPTSNALSKMPLFYRAWFVSLYAIMIPLLLLSICIGHFFSVWGVLMLLYVFTGLRSGKVGFYAED